MSSVVFSELNRSFQTSPSGSVVQEHDENDQRNRNSEEPKQDRHDVSPFVFEGLAIDRGGGVSLLPPGAVAESATFGRGERRGERADE